MTEDLVLASASTVRARLLAAAGIDFRIKPAELDEGLFKQARRAEGRDAAGCALALAEAKARQVAAHCGRAAVVIGADQVWSAERYDATRLRISGRPVPSFKLCMGRPTSLSREPVLKLLRFLRTKGMILS